MSSDQEKAELLLLKAYEAKELNDFETSLQLYQESLDLYLKLYKNDPNRSDYLQIIQANIPEAEWLKSRIAKKLMKEKDNSIIIDNGTEQSISKDTGSVSLKPQNSSSQEDYSFWSFLKMKDKPKSAKKSSNTQKEASNSSLINHPNKNGAEKPNDVQNTSEHIPDYHDYTVLNNKKSMIDNSESLSGNNLKSKGPLLEPTQKQTKKALSTPGVTFGGRSNTSNRPTSTTNNRPNSTSSSANSSTKTKAPRPNSSELNEFETQILDEMLTVSPGIKFKDISGLQFAKQILQEAVILPNLRPDLFTGLRSPPRGVLLFGPPGTGKTLLAKAVATESGFCFFSITPSSVTSKWLGEGEKLMKALFSVARMKQPSVIFFDEIDAIMSVRKENEHEASRRIKTEFMTQTDGAATNGNERLLIMAATNIPWDLDEAVLRRLVKRIYIPLPDESSRRALILRLLEQQLQSNGKTASKLNFSEFQIQTMIRATEGYSGSDLTAVCHEAAMEPIRELTPDRLISVRVEDVRPMNEKDFLTALKRIRPSVSKESLSLFTKWLDQYGTR